MLTSFLADQLTDTVLDRSAGRRLTVNRILSPSALNLLERTLYGTHGIRYQQTGQADKVRYLRHPLFFHLFVRDRLVGTYCLDERLVTGWPEPSTPSAVRAFYGRYLAVDAHYTGRGYGRLLKQSALAYVEARVTPPFLSYAYVEERNARSLAISQGEGFRPVAHLKTYLFRRYAPRLDPRFGVATPADVSAIRPRLALYYGHYRLKTLDYIGYGGHYVVLREQGQIVAGVQANPVAWRFDHLPGASGWAMMHLLPRLPPTRRLFNPAHYAFLVIEGVYLAEGRQELLPILLESTLAHTGRHTVLWQLDGNDPHLPLLKRPVMGVLSGFQRGVNTQVLVKSFGHVVDQEPLVGDVSRPVYVSGFDFS